MFHDHHDKEHSTHNVGKVTTITALCVCVHVCACTYNNNVAERNYIKTVTRHEIYFTLY